MGLLLQMKTQSYPHLSPQSNSFSQIMKLALLTANLWASLCAWHVVQGVYVGEVLAIASCWTPWMQAMATLWVHLYLVQFSRVYTVVGDASVWVSFYTTSRSRTPTNPPLSMQAIPTMYFMCFQVLLILPVMSDILFCAGIPLSQLTPSFYLYLGGFINICMALNTPPRMEVFLQFLTFCGAVDQAICMHRGLRSTSNLACINFPPSNYKNR